MLERTSLMLSISRESGSSVDGTSCNDTIRSQNKQKKNVRKRQNKKPAANETEKRKENEGSAQDIRVKINSGKIDEATNQAISWNTRIPVLRP